MIESLKRIDTGVMLHMSICDYAKLLDCFMLVSGRGEDISPMSERLAKDFAEEAITKLEEGEDYEHSES